MKMSKEGDDCTTKTNHVFKKLGAFSLLISSQPMGRGDWGRFEEKKIHKCFHVSNYSQSFYFG